MVETMDLKSALSMGSSRQKEILNEYLTVLPKVVSMVPGFCLEHETVMGPPMQCLMEMRLGICPCHNK